MYVVGGFDGQEVLNSVEVYDPGDNSWSFAVAMNSPRSGVSLVAYRDSLYALGGFDGARRLRSGRCRVERPLGVLLVPQMALTIRRISLRTPAIMRLTVISLHVGSADGSLTYFAKLHFILA